MSTFQPLSKSKLEIYSRLDNRKFRKRHGLFMAEGEKCVADTIEHFTPEALIISEQREPESFAPSIAAMAEAHPEIVRTASASQLKACSQMSNIPDVIAIYRQPEQEDLPDGPDPESLCLMLDGIQDPGNLGSIIRTADWFGIHTVIASRDTADVYNPKTVMATMGAISRVRVIYTDLPELLDRCKGMPVYGTLLDGENIYTANLSPNGIIIMGNEGKGLSEAVRERVSHRLLIPPYNSQSHGESLNVGAATAITLSEFRRR